MAKSFSEVFAEIKANVSVSKKGKPVRSFSRSDFDKLAKAWLNEVGYKVEAVSTKDGELVKKDVFPVQEFRNMLKVILQDFGVDKQAAAKVLDASYEIRNVDGMYEICSELPYVYMDAGKKFDFIPRENFIGSMLLDEVGESVGEFTDIRSKEKIHVQKKAHKILQKKSKCPKWLKSKVNGKKK